MRIGSLPGRRAAAVTLATFLAIAAAAVALAVTRPHPGAADRSFSRDGVALRDFGSEWGWGGAKQILAQPDGSALVLAEHNTVGRFLPDGSLDPGFGEGGYLPLDYTEANAMANTSDGGLLLVGQRRVVDGTPREAVVSRFDPTGAPDPSFGHGGEIAFEAPDSFDGPEGVFVEADGKILLVGRVVADDFSAVEAIRLLPNGGFDPSYGRGGHARIRLPGKEYAEYVNAPLTDFALTDGKLTLALPGAAEPNDLLVRIGPDGKPDRTLGGDGIVATRALDGGVSGLALQPDGRIVLCGERGIVARFLGDGSPDPGFGQGGRVEAALPGNPRITAVTLQPGGAIVLGGGTHDEANQPKGLLVARLTASGALDPGFGAGRGYVEADPDPAAGDEATAIAELPGGGLLLGGTSPEPTPRYAPRLALARFTPEGSPDPGFGRNGMVVTRPRVQARDWIDAAAPQAHGSVAVAGTAAGRVLLARYLSDGEPDPGFGTGGFVTTATQPGDFAETATSLAAYPGNRLLVGVASGQGGELLMFRGDGTPESGFGGGNGRVDIPTFDDLLDFEVDRDGSIVAVGLSYEECSISVARVRADGSLDPTFGSGGIAQLGRFSGACRREPVRLALRPSGGIVVAGVQSIAFFRQLTADGGPVESGKGPHRRYGDRPDKVDAMAVDSRNRLLMAGKEGTGMLTVARYTPDGFPDPSFGRDGFVRLELGFAAQGLAVRALPSGAVFVAAAIRECAGVGCEGTTPAVLRLTPSGKLDRTFGRRGVSLRHVGTSAMPLAMTLGPHTVTVAGWANRPGTGRDLFISRLQR